MRAHLGGGGQEAVDVVDVHRARPGPLQRGRPGRSASPSASGARVASRCGGYQQCPWQAQRRGQRHHPPGEPRGGRAGLVGGAHRHPVPAGAQRAGVEHAAGRHWPPAPVVHPVPLGGRPVGGAVVRRGHAEILLRRRGAPLRRPVHEPAHRRAPGPVGAYGPVAGGAHRDAFCAERKCRGTRLHDLGGGLGELQEPAGIGVTGDVPPGGERGGRGVRAGAALARRGARVPVVTDLEAEQPVPGRQLARAPGQARRPHRAAVAQGTGDPQRAVVPWRGSASPGEHSLRGHPGPDGPGTPRWPSSPATPCGLRRAPARAGASGRVRRGRRRSVPCGSGGI